jgi:hypothetical protein
MRRLTKLAEENFEAWCLSLLRAERKKVRMDLFMDICR